MSGSSSPHIIRLRGPWETELVTDSSDGSSEPNRRVRFLRRFGLPTGLQPGDQVDVVIESCERVGQVWLNDNLLGELNATGISRFAIRERLQPRNVLQIEMDLGSSPLITKPAFDDSVREVRLEIRTN